MKITVDQPGHRLRLESATDHRWRLLAGRTFLAAAGTLLLAVYLFLSFDDQVGPAEAAAVIAVFGGAGLAIVSTGVYALLAPRQGVELLSVDRNEDCFELQNHGVYRQPRAIRRPLSDLASATLVAGGLPSLSPLSLLRLADDLAKGVEPASELLAKEPLLFELRFRLSGGAREKPVRSRFKLAVDGLTTEQQLVELALKLGAVSGLPFGGVYRLSNAGIEVRLDRSEVRGSTALPTLDPEPLALQATAESALAGAGLPPLDIEALALDHEIVEWAPGRRVELRQPVTFATFLGPAGLLVLGATMWLALTVEGAGGTIAGAGSLLGVVLLLIGALSLPRRLVFDWATRRLELASWLRRRRLDFDRLDRLELKGVARESSSDSGGGSMTYSCELLAHLQATDESKPLRFLSTRSQPTPDEPFRQAEPLLKELADALGVDGAITRYDFNRR